MSDASATSLVVDEGRAGGVPGNDGRGNSDARGPATGRTADSAMDAIAGNGAGAEPSLTDAAVAERQVQRRPGRAHDPAVVATVRQLVETTELSFGEIRRRTDVAERTVSAWTSRHGWQRPSGAPAAGPATAHTAADPSVGVRRIAIPRDPTARARKLTALLYRVYAHQLGGLEARAALIDNGEAEKDARTLSTLVRTLQTLMALDRDDGAASTDPEAVDPDEIRAKLARRIYALGQGGQ